MLQNNHQLLLYIIKVFKTLKVINASRKIMLTSFCSRIQLLRPNDLTQRETLAGAIADILWKVRHAMSGYRRRLSAEHRRITDNSRYVARAASLVAEPYPDL
jgi:hypothetical protein